MLEVNQDYLDCGQIQAKGTLGPTLISPVGSLNLTIRGNSDQKTNVTVNFFGQFKLKARDSWDGRPIEHEDRCLSTGKIEKEILEYISKKN